MSPDYDTNTKDIRKERLYPLLVKGCHVAGFKVVCQYSYQCLAILVGCNRRLYHPENLNEKYQDYNGVKKACAYKTQRPINSPPKASSNVNIDSEQRIYGGGVDYDNGLNAFSFMGSTNESCRFKFSIYWDSNHQRWFFFLQQSGSNHHCGHVRLDSTFLQLNTNHILNDAKCKLATDSLLSKSSVTTTCDLMKQRTRYSLSWKQMNYLKEKNHKKDNQDVGTGGFMIAADRLLRQLEHDPSSSFIALFAEKTDLLTIKQKKRKKNLALKIDYFYDDLQDNKYSPLD